MIMLTIFEYDFFFTDYFLFSKFVKNSTLKSVNPIVASLQSQKCSFIQFSNTT